jgi:sulfur dioxygenase
MADIQKQTNLSCEQVYNLWLSEPQLIQIVDLRGKDVFQQGHIPSAAQVDPANLPSFLLSIGEKLAVLVAPDSSAQQISKKLSGFTNFVFLKNCSRWVELKFPVTSQLKMATFEIDTKKGVSLASDFIFQQLFEHESSTYTYLIADKKTKEAAIIDPVLETVDRDIKLIEEMGLKLIYALDTHIHADHITGAGELRKRLGIKTAVSQNAGVECVDIPLEDGQELLIGNKKIKVIATPGHTNTCLSYYFEGMVFTGDALLIRGCGRTDFQQGDSDTLFYSVREKLFKLPDDTVLYPGHDYRGHTSSTIGTEKKHNPRLKESISKDDFKKTMAELKLANPKKIHEAVPANLLCGKTTDNRVLHPQVADGIPEVSVEDVNLHSLESQAKKIKLIDVRRPDEFNNELGHIAGARLVTLGPELTKFLEDGDRSDEIVFICRSGARSGNATAESIRLGYKKTVNMVGGMIRWNEKKFLTERNN